MGSIEENVLKIQEEIAPYKPNIIAVTKYFDESKIEEAYQAGLRDFGESRVIYAIEKIQKLSQDTRQNSKFHLIGHLQSNKARKAVKFFDLIHSVDSLELAKTISQEAIKEGKIQKILLQLNNAQEEQKFGFSKGELFAIFEQIKELKGIEIKGLMNMAPFGATSPELKELFEDVVKTRNELEKKYHCELKEISMGMSGDYKEACEAGATMIRIGRKLFST
ncbi:MAG TPA: YggS family pyridoxal phosphate-dependent enzyme [Candidatus Gastranaerophilaceae bacterium]|nr:YggS family pyridoxal phosphate-dependent enzyme [Candidatus Gastranaerophilaceae bacterium]HPT40933.1 YggS family pyridoxal phosphate-dependent enzyme [Candidatus Gastranaerophilaceae bacterium]